MPASPCSRPAWPTTRPDAAAPASSSSPWCSSGLHGGGRDSARGPRRHHPGAGGRPVPGGGPGAVTAVVALIATVSGGLTLITAALGVAAWRGHPRGRIALMATLVLGVATDMVQVSSLGVRQATLGLVVTSALQVLALLALSARQVHQWEHARKEERLAGRASARGDRAAVRLSS